MTDSTPSAPYGSKLNPARLDAFQTLKDDEPYYVLQGGDPFAVRALAHYIHERRAVGIMMEEGAKRDGELIRCTETETILWSMQAYIRGWDREAPVASSSSTPKEQIRLDVHDVRRRTSDKISQFFSELNDAREKLIELGWLIRNGTLDNSIEAIIRSLRSIDKEIDIPPVGLRSQETS